jgi:2-phosphosulfolactate phosphatase
MPPLTVTLKEGLTGAAVAFGPVVIIDVLRAFTTAAYAFDAGVAEIILVGTAEEAFAQKRARLGLLLVGEDGGRKIDGFDVGNSPEAIEAMGARGELRGRVICLRSSSGTQGVVAAARAGGGPILLGSLVVAAATVRWLEARAEPATIVAMGSVGKAGGVDGPEDIACRDYMAALAAGSPVDRAAVRRIVEESPSGRECVDPTCDYKSPGDLVRAVAIDRFAFAMTVIKKGELLVACRAASIYNPVA